MKTEDLIRFYIFGQVIGSSIGVLSIAGLIAWMYFSEASA